MNVALIVNPFASAVSEERVRVVEEELSRAGTVRTVLTERAGHGVDLAAAASEEAVVVYSGDGGFNEVLNGVRDGALLGFLPGGGTNVLPRALGLPRDATAAARQVADALEQGRTRTTSTASRSPATGRLRSRPTARISATSTWRSSKPSGALLACSSRVSS